MTWEKVKLLSWLFKTDVLVSSFSFGGGYVVLPMIRRYFVEEKGLFGENELMDMAAVAQSSPGAIAINLAVLCGRKTAGTAGAVVAGIAAVLPPLVILSIVSACYRQLVSNPAVAAVLKGMEAGVAALIVDVVWYMSGIVAAKKEPLPVLMIPAAFAASFLFDLGALTVIVGGVAVFLLLVRLKFKAKEKGARSNA